VPVSVTRWDARFFETTRGKILALLRRGSRTIDELANALGITDNAVRIHVAALERDGVVHQRGVVPTGGKPAYSYEVVPEAERLFTKAYLPVLTQLVDVLEERLSTAELEKILTEVGRRLASEKGSAGGSVRDRAEAAATILTELGGVVEIVEGPSGRLELRGFSCPLADAVLAQPATCRAAESLVATVVGAPVRERCDRRSRPRCCFEILGNESSSD
jgi:predicted ArsR family transcriptional regulator